MEITKRITGTWRKGAVGALSAFVLGTLFLVSEPLGGGLSRLSFDLPYLFAPEKKVEGVKIVYMDEASHKVLLQHPSKTTWHRALHVALLRRILAEKPKAVVFDFLFDEPFENMQEFAVKDPIVERLFTTMHTNLVVSMHWPANIPLLSREEIWGKAVDWALRGLITSNRNLFFGGTANFQNINGTPIPYPLSPVELLGSNVLWGVAEFPEDADEKLRQQFWVRGFTNLSWVVAQTIGDKKLPEDQRVKPRWLRYYGPRKTIPSCSYYEIFTNTLPAGYFSNQVVFVGRVNLITGTGSRSEGDEFRTPYTTFGHGITPGVEIQATAYLNLVNRDWINKLWFTNPSLEFLLVTLFAVVFGFGLPLIRPWYAAGVAVVSFFLLATVAMALFWHKQLWFPWLIPGVVEIPIALGWAVLSKTKEMGVEIEQKEEKLDQQEKRIQDLTQQLTEARLKGSGKHPSRQGAALQAEAGVRGVAFPGAPTPSSSSEAATKVGPQIPNYQLIRKIGGGAYGEVWLCRGLVGTYQAVKFVYPGRFSTKVPFEREFNGLVRFEPISRSHPGLVHVLYVGKNEEEGYFYYIMELGDDQETGQTINPEIYSAKNLANVLDKQKRLPFKECLELALNLTAALDVLHKQNLVHRDIKPSNIIFVRDMPKIADIGLVTEAAEDRSLLGTAGYIAPDPHVTPSGDVYSLGKVIYEAAMGVKHPELPTNIFDWPDHKGLLELNGICNKACENNMKIRYKNAGELHQELLKLRKRLKMS